MRNAIIQKITKQVSIELVPFDQLTIEDQDLLKQALQVRKNAQAPYSNFCVGVAILSNKNTIHVGCNVERCTWTQTTHAEQNAVDSMVAAIGPAKISKIAIVADLKDAQVSLTNTNHTDALLINKIACGHCLQIIWENCQQDPTVKILIVQSDGIVACTTIGDLLPFRFGPENLTIFYNQ